MKDNFEVQPYCSSKYSDSNNNTLSRLVNSFIQAMNSKYYLPEYVIIFMDNDLIEHLQFKKFNLASLLGPWIKYLSQVIAESLQKRRQDLPARAKLKEITQIYWVEVVGHNNFDYADQQVREIFSQCIEVNCQLHDNMRMLKLRDYWDRTDDSLVIQNCFTKAGLSAYWRSMDASFQFNNKKREEYLIRSKFRALKASSNDSSEKPGKVMKSFQEDPGYDQMPRFFKRSQDHFHWNHSLYSQVYTSAPEVLYRTLNFIMFSMVINDSGYLHLRLCILFLFQNFIFTGLHFNYCAVMCLYTFPIFCLG